MIPADKADRARTVRWLARRDPVLGAVIDAVGPLRLKLQRGRFESLARAIVAQQISTSAAQSIWGRLRLLTKPKRVSADSLCRLNDDEIRAAGISPQKLGYLRDLQQQVISRTVRLDRLHHHADDRVIDELVRIKGIGAWTAQMFLMFSLGRADVLPHQDFGIRSAMRQLYELPDLPTRDECEEIAAPWRPHATIACWYLWRSSEIRQG
ncbi:MAG: DNA-3-methyladenine glycosylase 2 family protein [Planctomycetaceae bacterium]